MLKSLRYLPDDGRIFDAPFPYDDVVGFTPNRNVPWIGREEKCRNDTA